MKKAPYIIAILVIAAVAYGTIAGVSKWQDARVTNKLSDEQPDPGIFEEPVNFEGEQYLVAPTAIYDTGSSAEEMPAIDDPSYDSVTEADAVLADEVLGVIVPAGNVANFYSYQILNWHEVVNETIGDQKIAVTHCTLCNSSLVFDRVVDGQELHFEISGKAYGNITLLRDRETGSLWLSTNGLAVSGELIGTQLALIPSPVMTWGDFKDAFPSAQALSTNTGLVREYNRHPYTTYDTSEIIYFPEINPDSRIPKKWVVNGVNINGEQMAFSERVIVGSRAEHTTVGGERIVGFHDIDTGVTTILKPVTSEGEELTFTYDFDDAVFVDESGSTWTSYGLALSGTHEGERLEQVTAPEMFWFCWHAMYPETLVNQLDG